MRTACAAGARRRAWGRAAGRAAVAGAIAAMLGSTGGCTETDGWMLDPSVLGRWEYTPTTVPVLSRIYSIEGPADEYVEVSDPSPEDLIPMVDDYRIGAGDALSMVLWNIPRDGEATPYERLVDANGLIELPQLGQIYMHGLTQSEGRRTIEEAIRTRGLLAEPIVDLVVVNRRQSRVSIFGAVGASGAYPIPSSDYRLLDALIAAGGLSESPTEVYVIRQVGLSEQVTRPPTDPTGKRAPGDESGQPPEGMLDLIDELSRPGGGGNPGVLRPGQQGQPEQPPIRLIEEPPPLPRGARPESVQPEGEARWIFVDGQWIRADRAAGGAGEPSTPLIRALTARELVTQRVIRIPTQRLLSGDSRVNIVIRPGDVVRVPPPPTGNVFLSGKVARPGAFVMSERLTLQRLIAASGGLSAVAIPERVDIVRMIGPDRQAVVRVNLRAITEGTHPDIYLKANDLVNVGTNAWATPLAIIRNGFRSTYGFGFLVDRNFGNDIFGPPPVNRAGF